MNKSSEIQAIDSTAISTIPRIDSVQTTNPVVSKPVETDDSKFKVDDISFNYLKAKTKVSYKTPKESQSFTLDIRMKKDSVIWMNITALGISVATGIFTKDMARFYDKFHGKYTELNYDSLSTAYNVKLNYDIIQSLIIGNQPFKKNKSRVIRENDYYLLKQKEGKVQIENYIGQNRKLKKLLLTEQPTNNKLTMDFEDFNSLNDILFPFSSLITLDYQSNVDQKFYQTVINIKHSKVELLDTPLEFPFKVPEKLLKKH